MFSDKVINLIKNFLSYSFSVFFPGSFILFLSRLGIITSLIILFQIVLQIVFSVWFKSIASLIYSAKLLGFCLSFK